jgi:hypothetical protein
MTMIRIGPHTELNVATIEGNPEPARQTPMWGRGQDSNHGGLQTASAESFETIRRRLLERGATPARSPAWAICDRKAHETSSSQWWVTVLDAVKARERNRRWRAGLNRNETERTGSSDSESPGRASVSIPGSSTEGP